MSFRNYVLRLQTTLYIWLIALENLPNGVKTVFVLGTEYSDIFKFRYLTYSLLLTHSFKRLKRVKEIERAKIK